MPTSSDFEHGGERSAADGRDPAAQLATRIRQRALEMIGLHGFGYLGQAMSSAELLATLFSGPYRPDTDDLVLSPGHYVVAAYAAGAELGLIDEAELATYGRDASRLPAIGSEESPIVDLTCGSLGQGLSGALGFAIANRLAGRPAWTYAFLSDGELQEGQVWEAAMAAPHHDVRTLIVLLDCNGSQVDGQVSDVMSIEPVPEKWAAFGWDVFELDGHDTVDIASALAEAQRSPAPAVLVARTSPTRGLEELEHTVDAHFIKISPEDSARVHESLEARLAP
ncbi:transketolase [Egibacter rhizosphaerae]|uniref:Transketolase n=1 Tax=Egibacter rhizosphaerae TaxID=1670831 RepID=A0A411YHX6_9ACTN|nr:1-deoxy-D-xylulose-5-phosphate synthase N-terminal domain-containing protein [Egibacter rhizosphaerae]QBI20868.1 transketolase [Egibacter rhizosphaerae]